MKIILANPQGFCAGVERAIQIVETALELFDPPIYVFHEVVHNLYVIQKLSQKGAIFVEDINQVPQGSVTIFSAHGVSKDIVKAANKRKLKIYDATCPLVTKVHKQAMVYQKKNIPVILIGHKNHPEVIGTMGQIAKNNIFLVENEKDVQNLKLDPKQKVAYITQTTLSVDDCRDIIKSIYQKFTQVITSAKKDICYATENRQKAVKMIIDQADGLLVVGSANSSNSNRLREIGLQLNKPSYLVDDPKNIKVDWFNNINCLALSAGASAPSELVEKVLKKITSIKQCTIEKHQGIKEDVYFPIIKELRINQN